MLTCDKISTLPLASLSTIPPWLRRRDLWPSPAQKIFPFISNCLESGVAHLICDLACRRQGSAHVTSAVHKGCLNPFHTDKLPRRPTTPSISGHFRITEGSNPSICRQQSHLFRSNLYTAPLNNLSRPTSYTHIMDSPGTSTLAQDEIRLLRLSPPSLLGARNSVIWIEIRKVKFDHPPSYIAVSYAWGYPTATKSL